MLNNCTLEQNVSGVHVENGNPLLTDCSFTGNMGSAYYGSGTVGSRFIRCSFVETVATAAPTVLSGGGLTAHQCSFRSTKRRMGIVLLAFGNTDLFECEFTDSGGDSCSAILKAYGGIVTMERCSFVGNSASSVVDLGQTFAYMSHCLFTGNSIGDGALIFNSGRLLRLSNCTFAGNRGSGAAIDGYGPGVATSQCIFRDGTGSLDEVYGFPGRITPVTFSNIEGGCEGQGNVDVDPMFVREGYWADPNDPAFEVGPDDPAAVWIAGDYHLQSQAGHWDRETESWVLDETTSPCIDAGDPDGYLGSEPFPNGGYVNLGAYGGTLEASRSYFGKPVCENQLAGDINGDCIVDQTDIDILMSHWLMDAAEVPNIPPTATLIFPVDGDEIVYPILIELRAEAADPDGHVLWVTYHLVGQDGVGVGLSVESINQSPEWLTYLDWPKYLSAGPCTITVTAVDNEGAKTTSAPVTVNLIP